MIPLYSQAKSNFIEAKDGLKDINLGLYYQKFCHTWNNKFNDLCKKAFIDSARNKILDNSLLEEGTKRICSLVHSLHGSFKIYKLEERFVTGTGLDHPVEVGFLWDHKLGVPYIAGSSIKGVVRDWAIQWVEEEAYNIERIFGSNRGENQVGSVIFFDAFPYKAIKLKTDIITPHYGPYYSEGAPPGDWSNPTPIQFLTVDEGQSFVFFVAPRRREYIQDCNQVIEWLDAALINLGAGAKTAIGYGRFIASKEEEMNLHKELRLEIEEKERKEQLERMSPIRKEMEEDGYSEDDGERFMQSLTERWLQYLKDDTALETKKEIAIYLAEWYKTQKAEQWLAPKKKNVGKVELIRKFL